MLPEMQSMHLKLFKNDMIEVVGKQGVVQRDKYYSVIANEVADIGNKEQLSIVICYALDDCVK